uniref:Ervatamin-B-like n=1 Tax=Elaeis guineensis var. tenera TaxID=51953 RepID=A0A6J0PK52_ELAGV|nr:ervatamin-B-like [Elaeis guineensis]
MAHRCCVLALLILDIWIAGAIAGAIGDASVRTKFKQWMAKYGRVYTDAAEEERRFQIFKDNYEYIESANKAGNRTYTLGLNHFADMTDEEFQEDQDSCLDPTPPHLESMTGSFRYANVTDVPEVVDWIASDAVTRCESQGHCGSCWAFSAAAAIEGINAIKTGLLAPVSVQQLVDCDVASHGCKGGGRDRAFFFVLVNGGIAAALNYSYTGRQGECRGGVPPVATIRSYEAVPPNNESALKQAVANQPVAIALCTRNPRDIKWYSGGLFKGPCGTCQNHAMTVVGYGIQDTLDPSSKYWALKNSWGEDWGVNGFMFIQREAGPPEGLCGLAKTPIYPVK